MKKQLFAILGALIVPLTLLVTSPAQASAAAEPVDFSAQAVASGLAISKAADLQKRVDEILAAIPGGKQVSATEIRYDGLNVTVDPLFSEESSRAVDAIACDHGWFCIVVRGTRFEFFTCQKWALSNWLGKAPFNNNQTTGTVARAYDQNGTTEVWSHRAKGDGEVNVDPWWYFKPC